MTVAIRWPKDGAGIAEIGGKAAALAGLQGLSAPVPPFFVVTPAAFSGNALASEGRSALAAALSRLEAAQFAVRSSAREEDGASHSHAGQFLSLLKIAAQDVPAACEAVWRSGLAAGVRAYRTTRGLADAGEAPAVIVQALVEARVAGVMFSADPVSGRRDRIVISAVSGLADQLLSGEEDGDHYAVARDGGTVLEGPPNGVLGPPELAALAKLIAEVEARRGGPQDVEWAFDDRQLWLLQARPITTPLRPLPTPDPAVTIFDNSNIVESYPGLVGPLTYSFAQYAYARVYRRLALLLGVSPRAVQANGTVFDNMLGRLDGRVYYNLINWYRALALLPGYRLSRAHMETMMGVGEPLPAEIADRLGPPPAKGWSRIAEYGRMTRVGFGVLGEAIGLRRTIRRFEARLASALARDPAELDAMPATELAAEYRRIESELLDRWDAPLVNDLLCMVAFGASRNMLQRWCGPKGLELHNDIMIGQGDVISAEPAQRIRRMGRLAAADEALIDALAQGDRAALDRSPELASEMDAYIARYSDRCAEELKLESITLADDPSPLYMAVAGAARHQGVAVVRPDAGLAAAFAGRPVRRWIAARILGYAKARVRDRENLRFERTRIFGRARRLFAAAGRQFHALGLIDDPSDVFFLTVHEVLGAIEGFGDGGDLRAMASARRTQQQRDGARPDLPERISVTGPVLAAIFLQAGTDVQPSHDDMTRTGTGCSAGQVTGPARVVTDPRRERLLPGEILVARNTDPGWIALFTNAAAIVVERGSLLSHSAIVARELGIPCVVGVKGVLDWLKTGDPVHVDGASGLVQRRHE